MGIVIGILGFILVLICLLLGLLVLIQLPRKDAGQGMAFGSGAVDTLLGAGAGNALTTITKWVAGAFLALCLMLSLLGSRASSSAKASKGIREAASQGSVLSRPAGLSNALPATSLVRPAGVATNGPAAK
ncbi:MAG: preprotein translocase subunit SecG [Pedosphaera sp.]|nr:preprotein translocase subunit SecG [Pedosphaera sp.]